MIDKTRKEEKEGMKAKGRAIARPMNVIKWQQHSTANYRLQTVDYGPWTMDYGLSTVDHGSTK